jgi:hypothetical protein
MIYQYIILILFFSLGMITGFNVRPRELPPRKVIVDYQPKVIMDLSDEPTKENNNEQKIK